MSNNSVIDSYRETNRVSRQRARARKAGQSATLTLDEWRETLRHYDLLCAYCQINKFRVLDHFIPLCLGGGTTADNCIPACDSCNDLKLDMHPSMITSSEIFVEAVKRIQAYLETRRSEDL
jgi:5-methylcytosine-specific restriction endonuclease McrA